MRQDLKFSHRDIDLEEVTAILEWLVPQDQEAFRLSVTPSMRLGGTYDFTIDFYQNDEIAALFKTAFC